MQNNPLVSIVIPTYNRKKLVERLIRSILKSSYKNFEIIVIDDCSPDWTIKYLQERFGKNNKINLFRNNRNLFAAGSKNIGQKKANGDLIAFIDDDNVVDLDMIKELVQVFINDSMIGEAAPINYNFNSKKELLLTRSTRNMWTTKTLHLRSFAPFGSRKIWEADDAPNAFMVRSEILKKNKIEFRPLFGIMYEESDFAYRIRRAGYKMVMVRGAKIYHDIEKSLPGELKKDYLFHFIEDSRRSFVFARNRIIFHLLFSNKVQNLFILLFWVWFFTAYYCYKFIFYNGYGKLTLLQRCKVAFNYLRGTVNGYQFLFSKNHKF